MAMGVKIFCNICEKNREFKEFYKASWESKTGRMLQCKDCLRIKMKIYHQKNKGQISAYKKRWYVDNSEEKRKDTREWKKQNPMYAKQWHDQNKVRTAKNAKAWKARNPYYQKCLGKYKWALEKGELVRASNCVICNSEEKIHGHHHDYSKPLDVIWVCRDCHMDIHAKLKARACKERDCKARSCKAA